MTDRMPTGPDGRYPDSDWTPEDDDIVRRALLSLHEDVDAHVLPGPEVVKAVGNRRRRSRWQVTGLGLAAASVAIAAVGFSGVLQSKPGGSHTATAASSSGTSASTSRSSTSVGSVTSTTSSPTSPSSTTPAAEATPGSAAGAALLTEQSLLPTAKEWRAVLGVSTTPTVVESPAGVGDLLCTAAYAPGLPVTAQDVTVDAAAGPMAKQVDFIYATEQAAVTALNGMTDTFAHCPTPKPETVTQQSTDVFSAHPLIWSFADSDGNTGWVSVVQVGRSVSYLETWTTGAGLDLRQVAWLENLLAQRLEIYGPDAGTGGAVDRQLAGPPGNLPPADVFLDPADFASPTLTGGTATEAGPGQFEGSAQVTQACDADSASDGTFALMKVKKVGVAASYFATQRVRKVASADAEVTRLGAGFGACDVTSGATHTTSTAGPKAGMWELQTTFTDGSAPFVEFVAVSPTGTPGYVSTIVLTVPSGTTVVADDYWNELTRLAGLVAKH